MRLVKAKASFLNGDRFVTPEDGPFETFDDRAKHLVAAGLADYVAAVDLPAIADPERDAADPSAAKAERAVARNRAK